MTPERKQFLEDIMATAVHGGINYWARTSYVDAPEGYVWLWEREPSGENLGRVPLNYMDIEVGLASLKDRNFQVDDELRSMILLSDVMLDAGNIDAEAADVIVQASIFGEIVYG